MFVRERISENVEHFQTLTVESENEHRGGQEEKGKESGKKETKHEISVCFPPPKGNKRKITMEEKRRRAEQIITGNKAGLAEATRARSVDTHSAWRSSCSARRNVSRHNDSDELRRSLVKVCSGSSFSAKTFTVFKKLS